MAAVEPLIINLAPTGMVPTKDQTPHVPVTPEEVLADVERCRDLGASIIHVHARDGDGVPTHRKQAFVSIFEGIREIDPELITCVTCSGRYVNDLDSRAEVLELDGAAKPDMASLTLGSNNFRTQASVNSPDVIEGLAQRMLDRGIAPELEVFEPGMVDAGVTLMKRGLVGERACLNILLGNPGTSQLTPAALAAFLASKPEGWQWSLAGIGKFQLRANLIGLALGGNVRVGLEDNIWFDQARTELATNPMLVERIADAARMLERPIATPAQARELLGLPRAAPSPAKVSL